MKTDMLKTIVSGLALAAFALPAQALYTNGLTRLPELPPEGRTPEWQAEADKEGLYGWRLTGGYTRMYGVKSHGQIDTDRAMMFAPRLGHLKGIKAGRIGGSNVDGITAAEMNQFMADRKGRMDFDNDAFLDWSDPEYTRKNGVTRNFVTYEHDLYDDDAGQIGFRSHRSRILANGGQSFHERRYYAEEQEREADLDGWYVELGKTLYQTNRFTLDVSFRFDKYEDFKAFKDHQRIYTAKAVAKGGRYEKTLTTLIYRQYTWEGQHFGNDDHVGSGEDTTMSYPIIDTERQTYAHATEETEVVSAPGKSRSQVVCAKLDVDGEVYDLSFLLYPTWRLCDRVTLHGMLGGSLTRMELESRSWIFVNHRQYAYWEKSEHDWLWQWIAGVGAQVALTEKLGLTGSAEWRWTDDDIRIETPVGSASAEPGEFLLHLGAYFEY